MYTVLQATLVQIRFGWKATWLKEPTRTHMHTQPLCYPALAGQPTSCKNRTPQRPQAFLCTAVLDGMVTPARASCEFKGGRCGVGDVVLAAGHGWKSQRGWISQSAMEGCCCAGDASLVAGRGCKSQRGWRSQVQEMWLWRLGMAEKATVAGKAKVSWKVVASKHPRCNEHLGPQAAQSVCTHNAD